MDWTLHLGLEVSADLPVVSRALCHQTQHRCQAFFIVGPLEWINSYEEWTNETSGMAEQQLIRVHLRCNTLSILFSIKSSSICTTSMFFPPYFSIPPWTGTSIRTSRHCTGRLLRRFMVWLEEMTNDKGLAHNAWWEQYATHGLWLQHSP